MKIYYKNWRLFLIFLFLFYQLQQLFREWFMFKLSRVIFFYKKVIIKTLQKGLSNSSGSIYDKNGIPLAISITGFDLFALSGLSEDDF